MRTATYVICAFCLAAAPVCGMVVSGDFAPGTGAELRSSTNYLIADTLGQFVVGESAAPDDSYACGRIEHGFWHSDIHIPTIAEIKGTPNNQWVDAYAKLVTAGNGQFYRAFYVEEQDRTNAIRVNVGTNPTISVAPGDMIDVSGVIKGSDADRYIDYPVVAVRFPGAAQLDPFYTPNRWLGGLGTDVLVPGGAGVLNTSMLMKTAGLVTYVDAATLCRFFYVDDGSGLSDGVVIGGQTMRGLRVSIANLATGNSISAPSVGQYVTVTGICAPQTIAGGKVVAQIRPRNQDDIQPIASP